MAAGRRAQHDLHNLFDGLRIVVILETNIYPAYARDLFGPPLRICDSILPLPPGPKPLPLIGNALDIPKERPWLVFNQWTKIYGKHPYPQQYTSKLTFNIRGRDVFAPLLAADRDPW